MKVVFLDIDGVLNCEDNWHHIPRYGRFQSSRLSPDAVKLVGDLCNRTESKIVISSTWRRCHSMEDLKSFLQRAGLKNANDLVIDRTPGYDGEARGKEIADWLLDNALKIESLVILDDNRSRMDPLKHRLVQTSWLHGLLPHHIESCIKILLEPFSIQEIISKEMSASVPDWHDPSGE